MGEDRATYDSVADALDDHGRLLASSKYSVPGKAGIKGEKDYKKAANLLIKNPSGLSYATNEETYVTDVIKVIESWNLTQYD